MEENGSLKVDVGKGVEEGKLGVNVGKRCQ